VIHRPIAIALLCSSPCPAQFTASAFANTTLIVGATGAPNQTVTPGTNISSGAHLSAVGNGASAYLDTSLVVAPNRIEFQIRDEAFAGSGASASAGSGPHETLLVITTTTPLFGRFVLQWTGSSFLNGSPVPPSVDLGNDGTIEFSPSASSSMTIQHTVAVGTFAVWMRTGATSFSPPIPKLGSSAISTLSVVFEPDAPVTTNQLSPACGSGSPSLAASANFQRGVDLTTTGLSAPGSTTGVLVQVIGFQTAPAPIPVPFPPHCSIQTDVALTALVVPVSSSVNLGINLNALRPIQFNAQSVWLDTTVCTVTTSNTVRIVCP
jgi:hypothetical protein